MPRAAGVEDRADDRALIERAKHDRLAFAELYRAHVGAVHAYVARTTGSRDVADEVTSATFEKALRALPAFEWRGGGVRPWLLRIASNELAGWYRSHGRATGSQAQQAATESLHLATPDDPSEARSRELLVDAIREVLPSLRPNYRDAISLRYLGSMSATDAAAAIGCSKATLAITLHRGLAALRIALDQRAKGMRS